MFTIRKIKLKKDRLLSKFFLTFFTFDLVSIPNEPSYPKIELQVEDIKIKIDDFGSTEKKVCCVSNKLEPPEVIQPQTEEKIEPEKQADKTEDTTASQVKSSAEVANHGDDKAKDIAVLYFPGWPGPGCNGIDQRKIMQIGGMVNSPKIMNSSKSKSRIKFIMAQYPGAAKKLQSGNRLLESDLIDKADYRQLEKYDAAILKKLKEENGGRLHAIGHSLGGLRILHAYLTLSEKDREGISISLIDPFIPSKSPQHWLLLKFIGFINLISPTYDWSFYDIITLPFTIVGRVLSSFINFVYLFSDRFMVSKDTAIRSDVFSLIRYSSQKEKKILKLLEKAKDDSLDIRQILVMSKNGTTLISPNGFAKYPKYTEFLEKELLPKCKKSADGNMLQLEKLAQYDHVELVWNENEHFAKWIKEVI